MAYGGIVLVVDVGTEVSCLFASWIRFGPSKSLFRGVGRAVNVKVFVLVSVKTLN